MSITVYPARKIITMNPVQPHATPCGGARRAHPERRHAASSVSAWGAQRSTTRFADKVLMPGLIEGHSHLKEGSMWDMHYLGWFDRRDPQGKVWSGLRSMDAVVARLAEVDARARPGNAGRRSRCSPGGSTRSTSAASA